MSVTPIGGVRYWYNATSQAFEAPGRPSLTLAPAAPSRDQLVYGAYEPDATTTGVPDPTVLTDYNAPATDKVTIPSGAVITDKTIYGDMTFAGPATLTRCLCVGGTSKPTSDIGIATCTGSLRSGIATFIDCTFDARVPANGRNGVQGRQYRAERCRVRNVTDGFGVFSTLGANTAADVTILGCLVDQLLYTYPDTATTNHSDGAHTDCIQHQGGLNVTIIGNSLQGYAVAEAGTGANPDKPWLLQHNPGWANGGCVTIQNNTGAGVDASTVVDRNWTRGGVSHYNLKLTGAGAQVSNGRVYRDVAVGTGLSGYWVRLETGLTQTSYAGLDTHVWVDGPYADQPLTFASRDRGEIIG